MKTTIIYKTCVNIQKTFEYDAAFRFFTEDDIEGERKDSLKQVTLWLR